MMDFETAKTNDKKSIEPFATDSWFRDVKVDRQVEGKA